MYSLDFKNPDSLVNDQDLVIALTTRLKSNQLLAVGEVSERDLTIFFEAARHILIRATEYLLMWCPLKYELIAHAAWIDFEHRLEKNYSSVEFFVYHFPGLFPSINMDRLQEQLIK